MQTLHDARQWLLQNLEKGEHCPCCGQFAKRYKRSLNSSMAQSLALIYRYFETNSDWLHIPSYLAEHKANTTNDAGLLVHWLLLEKWAGTRTDGSERTGFYRITDLGKCFVRDGWTIPKYIFLYNQQLLGRSDGVYEPLESTTFKEALGEKFNYDQLMRGT